MRKFGILILIVIGFFALVGCSNNGGSEEPKMTPETFEGEIISVEDGRLMVKGPAETFPEVAVNVTAEETKVVLKDGTVGAIADLVAGGKIKVTYSGAVATSMPPQIFGTEIEIL